MGIVGKVVLMDWTECFLRLELMMGFVRKRDFELGWRKEGFGLKRGDTEGEDVMVSMGESRELEMNHELKKKIVTMFYMSLPWFFGWFGFVLFWILVG